MSHRFHRLHRFPAPRLAPAPISRHSTLFFIGTLIAVNLAIIFFINFFLLASGRNLVNLVNYSRSAVRLPPHSLTRCLVDSLTFYVTQISQITQISRSAVWLPPPISRHSTLNSRHFLFYLELENLRIFYSILN